MQVLGAVDAQAYVEVVLLKKLAPRFVQQHAVGLEVVPDVDCAGIFSLEFDYVVIEVEPQQRGLPAVPVEDDFINLLAGNVLADELLQEIAGDAAGL